MLILCLLFFCVSFSFSFSHGEVKGNSEIEIIMKTKKTVMRLELRRCVHKSKNERVL